MRPYLVSTLCSKLLGPAGGPLEVIRDRPDLTYSVGILAPKRISDELSGLEDEQNSTEEEGAVDETGGDENIEAPPAPWLDPTSKPSSFGISFSCSSINSLPRFEVCITYARYQLDEETREYTRVPRGAYVSPEMIESSLVAKGRRQSATLWFQSKERDDYAELIHSSEDRAEIGLTVHIRQLNNDSGIWTITLLLHSEIKLMFDGYKPELESELNLHQPELRVNVLSETTLTEPPQRSTGSREDQIDAELYKGRGQLARGHMTSAIWKAFDPQSLSDEERDMLVHEQTDGSLAELGHQPPFQWIDANHPALEQVSERFAPPDVRTEFLPMLNIPAPDMNPDWDHEAVYDASALAEAKTADEIWESLAPLVEGYEAWIEASFDSGNAIHDELKAEALDALTRMQRGVAFLQDDEFARAAFNTANEALAKNADWRNEDEPLLWRKFQLAFALSTLESAVKTDAPDREKLDLLWVATGGGKTEAYLLIAAFVLVYRRLANINQDGTPEWQGVNILTRYTLRLLTIQQFRRSLGMITALEYIRVERNNEGHPHQLGQQSFSIGMWVGGGVSPNEFANGGPVRLAEHISELRQSITTAAQGQYLDVSREFKAVEVLTGGHALSVTRAKKASEPAQLINCPCCYSWLSFPRGSEDYQPSKHATVNWVVETTADPEEVVEWLIEQPNNAVVDGTATIHDGQFATLTLELTHADGISEATIESIASEVRQGISAWGESFEFMAARPSRPGYFLRYTLGPNGRRRYYDFEIRCPSPICKLNNIQWSASLPSGSAVNRSIQREASESITSCPVEVLPEWCVRTSAPNVARGIPIPAYTCDYQVYGKLPSMLITTVDKFARMPFEPKSGQLFGNVTHHHETQGFMRENSGGDGQIGRRRARTCPVPNGLPSPELVIQDELHLIEGPLGSMVGFYETVVEALMREGRGQQAPKYIASTATIRAAQGQVKSLFGRDMHLFPPKGPTWKDRGLICEVDGEAPSSKGNKPGRLYLGFCPIGISGLGVQRDVFASLLHHGHALEGDRYWSLVGYYNAVKELAAGRALVEQDVEGALNRMALEGGNEPRNLALVELSGRMDSSELPILLNQLEDATRGDAGCVDVLLTTSMFGTGVDITRLNVMFVGGQPKTTAQYIQATGRVGRKHGALVGVYLRGARPRDLDHYERFLSYHLQIHRYVEPVTVRPYSMAVLERAGGPLSVAWLRNSRMATTHPWASNDAASQHVEGQPRPTEFDQFQQLIQQRNHVQPPERRIDPAPPNAIESLLDQGWGAWGQITQAAMNDDEADMQWKNHHTTQIGGNPPPNTTYVVLGDERHVKHPDRHQAAYSPSYAAPNSLRTVDSTTGVEVRRND